jgi:hypothetical protein
MSSGTADNPMRRPACCCDPSEIVARPLPTRGGFPERAAKPFRTKPILLTPVLDRCFPTGRPNAVQQGITKELKKMLADPSHVGIVPDKNRAVPEHCNKRIVFVKYFCLNLINTIYFFAEIQ